MRYLFWVLFVWLAVVSSGCQQRFASEKEEAAFWNQEVLNQAHEVLYRTKQVKGALKVYDSLLQKHSFRTPYIEAARYSLLADYHNFFTNSTASVADAVDSALSYFSTPALQSRYPRSYVGYLLYGGDQAYQLSNYGKANQYYFLAKRTADAHLNPCERSSFSYNMAMVLYRQEKFAQSADYFTEAYASQSTCPVQTKAIVLQQQEIQSNIGLCRYQLQQYDSALLHFSAALRLSEHYRDSLGPLSLERIYGVVYGNMAKVYIARNQLELGEEFSKKSIALNARPGNEIRDALNVQLQLADVYGRLKNTSPMWQVMQQARRGLDTIPTPEAELKWRRLMSDYYGQTGQPALQVAYLKKFLSLQDSLAANQKALAQADITRQLKEKEQERQILALKKDGQLSRVYLWIFLIGCLMAMAIIGLIYHNYRRNRKSLLAVTALNEEVNRQKAALESETAQRQRLVTEAVIKAQEKERSLIGLELHDNVNQVLTTVKLHIEMLGDGLGDAKVLVRKSSGYLQACINEIRSLSKRLSAPTLGNIKLEDSVRDLIESINLTNKIQISQELAIKDNTLIQPDIHLAVYRILQEALNNIIKHAEAASATVEISQDDSFLYLRISDNGKGCETPVSTSGIGITNMRTRAENLAGSFVIKGTPGKGCEIQVQIPLHFPQ